MVIWKEFTFEASHVLPKHEGKCSRLHGHSWKLSVAVSGPVNSGSGFVVDYGKLGQLVQTNVIDILDHTHLGCGRVNFKVIQPQINGFLLQCPFGVGFYPTSENLAQAIFKLLKSLVQELGDNVQLHEVQINETCTSGCSYNWRDDESIARAGA